MSVPNVHLCKKTYHTPCYSEAEMLKSAGSSSALWQFAASLHCKLNPFGFPTFDWSKRKTSAVALGNWGHFASFLTFYQQLVVVNCASLQQAQRTAPRLWVTPAQQRWASSLPMNTVVLFVPQQEAWVVERMGRFHRILEPVSPFTLRTFLIRGRCCQTLRNPFHLL